MTSRMWEITPYKLHLYNDFYIQILLYKVEGLSSHWIIQFWYKGPLQNLMQGLVRRQGAGITSKTWKKK
jgi:hypothetical protein